MAKCSVEYFTNEQGQKKWLCRRYGLCGVQPVERETCNFYQCQGKRPDTTIYCHWKDCDNPKAPNKHRHCSEICRKRDNRYAYKLRQKAKKLALKAQESQSDVS